LWVPVVVVVVVERVSGGDQMFGWQDPVGLG
jgi:hypothetical protein